IRSHERLAWIAGLPVQKIADSVARGETVPERSVNAAGGDRRHHPGSVADEHHAARGDRPHDAAAWNHPRADRDRSRATHVCDRRNLLDERPHRFSGGRLTFTQPAGDAHLKNAHACDDPSDIPRRKTSIDEAVEPARFDDVDTAVFVLDTKEE